MLHITYVHLTFKMQEKKNVSSLEATKVASLGSQKQPRNQFYLALENLKLPPQGSGSGHLGVTRLWQGLHASLVREGKAALHEGS